MISIFKDVSHPYTSIHIHAHPFLPFRLSCSGACKPEINNLCLLAAKWPTEADAHCALCISK
jgi:hypothetical protein